MIINVKNSTRFENAALNDWSIMTLSSFRASLAVKLVAVVYLITTLLLLVLFIRSKTNKENVLDKQFLFHVDEIHTDVVHRHTNKETKKDKIAEKNAKSLLNNYVKKIRLKDRNITSSKKDDHYTINKAPRVKMSNRLNVLISKPTPKYVFYASISLKHTFWWLFRKIIRSFFSIFNKVNM